MSTELSGTKTDRPLRICLVTGAAGFIGQYLCSYLQENDIKVKALLRQESDQQSQTKGWDESKRCQLGVDPLPDKLMEGVDTIFHLAGVVHSFKPTKEMERDYWAVNAEATQELLSKAKEFGVKRFIYFSSVKAMADPKENCVDETFPKMPSDVYGLTKRKAEESVLAAGESGEIHVCNLRPSLVYGPGCKGNLLRMMAAIDSGRFPPLADSGNRRSMVHIDDLIQAATLAAVREEANGKTYIVTDGQTYSTSQMYVWICEALGKKIPNWSVPGWILQSLGCMGDLAEKITGKQFPVTTESVERLLGSACYSCKKIKEELGYRPQKDFKSSLPEMVAHFREYQRTIADN
jgi:nucleoside-diphosphate-sugar epimerase